MSDPSSSSQLGFSTSDAPITSTTLCPEPVNLPLAIALPICLFVFFVFLVVLLICLVRKKKCCLQNPVEPSMSRGSVEGSSDNGDNNNNDGETDNHHASGISSDGEILQVGGKPKVYDVPPELPLLHQNTCVRNPDESFCLHENQDETESTTRSVINDEENSMPEVCEHKTSDVVKETVAVSSPFGQQSQTQDAAIEIPPEEQDNFQTYIAVYSFEAENENQMSLAQNEIVLVAETEEHEGWLCGWKKSSSQTGWFPKSHVREVEQHSSGTIGSKLSDSTESDDDFDKDVTEYECRALYAFDGDEEGELSFEAGDSLVVHHEIKGTGWLYGERGDKVGWFPATYVEVIPGSSTSASSDIDLDSATTTNHDLEGALETVEQKRVDIASTDIVPEVPHLSSSIATPRNFPCPPKSQNSKKVLKTNKEDATPPSAKRPPIPSGKSNISDRLGLSKIRNFRRRKTSTDEPSVTLKEVVLVPSPVSPGKHLHEKASSATRQKQTRTPGISDRLGLSKIRNFSRRKTSTDEPSVTLKEVVLVPSPVSPGKNLHEKASSATRQKQIRIPGKKEPLISVISPPQAPKRQSLPKPPDQEREKLELSSCNRNQSSLDQNPTLPDANTDNSLKDPVTTVEDYDSSKPLRVVVEPIEDTKRTRDVVVVEESGCVDVLVAEPFQSKPDDTKRKWDIALENFDRILEGSNDENEDSSPVKSTNLFPSLRKGLSGSKKKSPDHRDRSAPQVTHPDAVNESGPFTMQLRPPQVNSRKTSEERPIDNSLMHGDEVSRKSELGLLSFAPPGFNDSEEVLSPKFLNYLSNVGKIDKTRLSQAANTGPPLRRQSSLHPTLPPKPSWPPTSDKKDEEHNNEGHVSNEGDNDGTLTFVIQKGRSNRQSLLSTLLLPDVMRGFITTDEYEQLQIPPPAGFSTDPENVEENNCVVSLELLDPPSNFREIQTPRYFGRTMYGPQEDDSKNDSSVLPEARQKVSESGEVPVEVPTDTVVWKPWEQLEPKIARNSYTEDVESLRSRHDTTTSHGVMFKFSDGSVVLDESDVGLESVI